MGVEDRRGPSLALAVAPPSMVGLAAAGSGGRGVVVAVVAGSAVVLLGLGVMIGRAMTETAKDHSTTPGAQARRSPPARGTVHSTGRRRSLPDPPLRVGSRARSTGDRDRLVGECIAVRDQLSSGALRSRLGRALSDVGILDVDPIGQPFDAELHTAVEVVPTTDRSLHNRVASTERVGYRDGERPLRLPEVAVYRCDREAR